MGSLAESADKWFEDIRKVQFYVSDNRKDHHRKIKVVMLDTGVDATHTQIREARNSGRLKASKGFPDRLLPLKDKNGHGTHGASIILKTAPDINLYIARVSDDRGKTVPDNDHEALIAAIQWAMEVDADIISISWGFEDEIPALAQAIEAAYERGIIVVASPSNDGRNKDIVDFPARMDKVFCIGAADGKGNTSIFNPPTEGVEKYSTLGEQVLGAVKGASEEIHNTMARRDGASTATAIAAGLIALFLEYIRQFSDRIKGPDNFNQMRKILLAMSSRSAGEPYRYLNPWTLLRANHNLKETIKDILQKPPGDSLSLILTKFAALDKTWIGVGVLGAATKTQPGEGFVDRENLRLASVEQDLIENQRVVMHGMPGVGKTEMAIQFVNRARQCHKYRAYFWIRACDEESIATAYRNIATMLGLVLKDESDGQRIAESLRAELNKQDQWIMVLDNVQDVNIVKNKLPDKNGARHVIITTRYGEAFKPLSGLGVEIRELTAPESYHMFRARCEGHVRWSLDNNKAERNALHELLHEVGHLPLAVIQSEAYISSTGMAISEYLTVFRKGRFFWTWKPRPDMDYRSLAVILTMSLSALRDPTAVRLLCLISFLHPESIHNAIWTVSETLGDQILRNALIDKHKFDEALGALAQYQFVRRPSLSDFISIHRIVQRVIRDLLADKDNKERRLLELTGVNESVTQDDPTDSQLELASLVPENELYWTQRAIEIVAVAYPSNPSLDNMDLCQRYNPHALECIAHADRLHLVTRDAARLQVSVAMYFLSRGDLEEAERHLERATRIYESLPGIKDASSAYAAIGMGRLSLKKGDYERALERFKMALILQEEVFGKYHINCVAAIIGIGKIYHVQGKYEEAMQQFERALRIQENTFGKEHIDSVEAILEISRTCDALGKYDEATSHCERALKIQTHVLGENHLSRAATIEILGWSCHNQGRYRDAKTKFQDVLRIRKEIFGPNHISIASTLSSLGCTCDRLGEYDEAVTHFLHSLRISENAYGVDHINQANTLVNLGGTYRMRGEFHKAKTRIERALKIQKRVFGEGHVNTAMALQNLGSTYEMFAKYDKAKELVEQALKITEKTFGEDNINTTELLKDLGNLCYRNGTPEMLKKAYEYYHRGLSIVQHVHGVDHISTADFINNLGLVLEQQLEYDPAVDHFQRALSIKEREFGKDHDETTQMIMGLARIAHNRGKYPRSIQLNLRVLQIKEREFGKHNISLANVLTSLGNSFLRLNKPVQALAYFGRSLKIKEAMYGKDHPNCAVVMMNIGVAHLESKYYHRAADFLGRSYQILRDTFGEDDPRTKQAFANLLRIHLR